MKSLCTLVTLLSILLTPMVVSAELQAAISIRNVTPDPLLPISGGGGEPSPATDKRGELEIRALVVEQGDTRVAIVTAPYIGFPRVLGDRVRAKVTGVPGSNVLIGATHSHSAPEMYAFPDGKGGTWADLKYIESVVDKISSAINEAVENLQPAALKVATGKANGKIAYNYYAPRLYDPRANIMQFIDASGKPFITLVNYAIHPEVLGPKSGFVSPDMVGPLHDHIEKLGGGKAIFMNGAQGGMVTADCRGEDGKDIQTWEECIRIGNLLAEESIRIMKDAPVQTDAKLRVFARELEFPVESEQMLAIVKYSPLGYTISEDNKVSTQFNLVNLGNAQFMTIPGEALPNIGYYLKKNMTGKHNFLLGLTNDGFGYILTKEDFESFERYEYISRTSLGEQTGEILVDAALDFINASPKPQE